MPEVCGKHPCHVYLELEAMQDELSRQLQDIKLTLLRSENVRQGKLRELRETLTPRELRVLRQIGLGRTTKEIGSVLCISPKTVEAHRAKIKKKLGATNTAELSYWLEVAGEEP